MEWVHAHGGPRSMPLPWASEAGKGADKGDFGGGRTTSINCAQREPFKGSHRGDLALLSSLPAPWHTCTRAALRKTTTPRRRILIVRLPRDRIGTAERKRGPPDYNPTAQSASASAPELSAAS